MQSWLGMLRIGSVNKNRIASSAERVYARDCLSLLSERARLKEKVDSDLYELIGAVAEGSRRQYIQLRRDLYNLRRLETISCQISETKLDVPDSVLKLLDNHHRLYDLLKDPQTKNLDRLARNRLAELINDPNLLSALAPHAPEIYKAIKRYDPSRPCSDSRKSERGILQYLTRAMFRTSPLGRYTAIGLTQVSVGENLLYPNLASLKRTSTVSVDRAMARHILSGLQEQTLSRNKLINFAWAPRIAEGRCSVYRTRGGKTEQVSITLTETVAKVLEILSVGPVSYGALGETVKKSLGASLEQAYSLLDSLVEEGFLVIEPPGPEMADAKFASPHELTGDTPEVMVIEQSLETLATTDDPDQRYQLAEATRQALNEFSNRVDRPCQAIVNEDYRLETSSIQTPKNILTDLGQILEFETAFDGLHVIRELLIGAFIDMFGEKARLPLIDCAQQLSNTVYARQSILDLNNASELGSPDGSLVKLLQIQDRAAKQIFTRLDSETSDCLCLSPNWLRSLVADLPETITSRPEAYAVIGQFHSKKFIWSDAYSGSSMLLSRHIAWADSNSNCRQLTTERIRKLYSKIDRKLLVDRGLHRVGLNNRPALLDEHITGDD